MRAIARGRPIWRIFGLCAGAELPLGSESCLSAPTIPALRPGFLFARRQRSLADEGNVAWRLKSASGRRLFRERSSQRHK